MSRGSIAVVQGKFDGPNGRFVFTLDGDLQAHVLDLRIVENLFQVVDRRVRYVVRFQFFDPNRARLFFEKYCEGLLELVIVRPAIRPRVETWVIDQLRMAD